MARYNLFEEYSPALTLACIMITFLCNIVILTRIKYGPNMITKNTLKPYKFTLAFLAISLTTAFLRYFIIGKSANDKMATVDYWNNVDGYDLIAFSRLLDNFANIMFVYFIAVRIDSCAIMYQFMIYQKGYRLEELDIVKEEFNRVERKSKRLMDSIMVIYSAVLVTISFANNFGFKDKDT